MFYRLTQQMPIIKHQFHFKRKAYLNLFSPLLIVQLVALLFSLGGIAQGGMGMGIRIQYYSADVMLVFTFLWALFTGIQLSFQTHNRMMQNFITDHRTETISNGLLLGVGSVIAGFVVLLSRFILEGIVTFFFAVDFVIGIEASGTFFERMSGFCATILYIFLFSSIGYFFGSFMKRNRLFVFLIPSLIIGLFFYYGMTGMDLSKDGFYAFVYQTYFQEAFFLLLLLKVIMTSILLFIGSYFITHRMEVR